MWPISLLQLRLMLAVNLAVLLSLLNLNSELAAPVPARTWLFMCTLYTDFL